MEKKVIASNFDFYCKKYFHKTQDGKVMVYMILPNKSICKKKYEISDYGKL